MKRRNRMVLFARRSVLAPLAALVLVAVAPEANSAAGTPITSCGQVVAANAVLTQDLVCTGDGIVVGAAGITIDLKGFVLRGNRSADNNGIEVNGFDRVTIKNGVVRNFYYGVLAVGGADTLTVQNVLASGNVYEGIAINGDSASLKSSTSAANGSQGISVNGDGTTSKSTSAWGNHFAGIGASGNFVLIQSSTASGNGYVGIAVQGDAAMLKGNRAEANGFFGQASDLDMPGINVVSFTTPPVGKNIARGNDEPTECNPTYLC
jgi:hypothetical protein